MGLGRRCLARQQEKHRDYDILMEAVLEHPHLLVHKFFHFAHLKPTFLFYTLIFAKHPHQFVYYTHLFK